MLTGKTALITGSTQGLGLATADLFAAAGCHVILNGFAQEHEVAAIRDRLERHASVRTLYAAADLRHPAEIEQMIGLAAAAFGTVDILVNNAVVRHNAPVDRFPASAWDEALAVNLSAAFHTIRLALPMMKAKGWGRIVNVSSIYGLRGAVNRAAYVTTKAALVGLTRAVALETAGQNITCNAVCPGTTRTPVHEAALEDLVATGVPRAEAAQRLLAGKQPTGRLVEPTHVARLMLFLCGPEGADITGAVLPVDGGWSAT